MGRVVLFVVVLALVACALAAPHKHRAADKANSRAAAKAHHSSKKSHNARSRSTASHNLLTYSQRSLEEGGDYYTCNQFFGHSVHGFTDFYDDHSGQGGAIVNPLSTQSSKAILTRYITLSNHDDKNVEHCVVYDRLVPLIQTAVGQAQRDQAAWEAAVKKHISEKSEARNAIEKECNANLLETIVPRAEQLIDQPELTRFNQGDYHTGPLDAEKIGHVTWYDNKRFGWRKGLELTVEMVQAAMDTDNSKGKYRHLMHKYFNGASPEAVSCRQLADDNTSDSIFGLAIFSVQYPLAQAKLMEEALAFKEKSDAQAKATRNDLVAQKVKDLLEESEMSQECAEQFAEIERKFYFKPLRPIGNPLMYWKLYGSMMPAGFHECYIDGMDIKECWDNCCENKMK